MRSSFGEPLTMLTDFALAITLAWCGGRMLLTAARRGHLGLRLWGLGFAAAGAGAVFGGTSHGFRDVLYPAAETVLWYAAMIPVGAAGFFLISGTAIAVAPPTLRAGLVTFGLGKWIGYVAWIAQQRQYLFVAIDGTLSAAIVLPLLAWASWRRRFTGFRWLGSGIALALAAAALRHTEWNPHPRFGHNDLFHLLLIVAVWWIHKGALRLADAAPAPNVTTGLG